MARLTKGTTDRGLVALLMKVTAGRGLATLLTKVTTDILLAWRLNYHHNHSIVTSESTVSTLDLRSHEAGLRFKVMAWAKKATNGG